MYVRRLRLADDHQPPVGGAQDLDGHAVETRQRGTGDHIARPPDSGGLNGFVTAMEAGMTDQQVIADLLASPEFFAKL